MDGSPCILWTGRVREDGYGTYSGKLAHRVVWLTLVGYIPEGYELDHICKVRHCVNILHLEPVTHAENVSRSYWGIRTTCKNGHPKTEENVRHVPAKNGRKAEDRCRPCENDNQKRYQMRKKMSR